MTERKFQPVDSDLVAEQFEEMPPEELAEVRSKMEAAEAKRGITTKPPDFARMSDAELREYNRKHYGF